MRLSRTVFLYSKSLRGHVTVATPLSGTICRLKAGTCYDQDAHQI